jgi:hypothetical protein
MLPIHDPALAKPISVLRSLVGAQRDHIELTLGQNAPYVYMIHLYKGEIKEQQQQTTTYVSQTDLKQRKTNLIMMDLFNSN